MCKQPIEPDCAKIRLNGIKTEQNGDGDKSDAEVDSISITNESVCLPQKSPNQYKLSNYLKNTPLKHVLPDP